MRKNSNLIRHVSMVLLSVILILGTVTFIAPDSYLRADTKDGEIVNVTTTVNVRKEPTTKSDVVVSIPNATKLQVTETVNAKSGDTSGSAKWCKVTVKVNNQTYTGYVAETFVKISQTTTTPTGTTTNPTTTTAPTATTAPSNDAAFEDQIKAFPDSYKASLRELHKKYPKWQFVAETSPKSWNEMLNLESRNGVSLVQNTVDNAWKSKASGSYDPATKTFKVIDSPNWVNASRSLVAYYLDPRNSLAEDTVFQFLDLSYGKSGLPGNDDQYVQKVLSGTFMATSVGKYANSNLEYSKMFAIAGYNSGINPLFLASKSVQEVGVSGSSSSNGSTGFYNFYNIGAYSDATNSAYVGLKFAQFGNGVANSDFNKKYLIPWDSQGKSIFGGAYWMSDYYVSKGQNTIYYMRFNASPKSAYKIGYHQYMTATQSASSEATRVFKAYDKSGLVNVALTFVIPVYTDMPATACPLPTKENAAAELVTRSYKLILGRDPSATEITNMSTKLVNGEEATDLIAELFESDEYKNKKISIEDQVKLVYKVLLDRDADEAGLKYYVDLMNSGYSVLYPFSIISGSDECHKFLDLYGVIPGAYVDRDSVDNNMQLKPFVNMLYTGFMGREPDPEGLRYWLTVLTNKSMSGQDVAVFFYNSKEFQGLNLDNDEFVKRLYKVCLGRDYDADGLKYWKEQLEKYHYSRTHILEGFLNSKEYNEICDKYKVSKTKYTSSTTYQLTYDQAKVEAFVTRLYKLALGRDPDPDGFTFWCNEFKNGTTGSDGSYGFIFSPELSGKNLTDEEFVEVLYTIFLDRASEADGKTYWVNQLKGGASRQQVFQGFMVSNEFAQLCIDAGIKPTKDFQL
ncbi:MAG: DUF4214 domain-containing protein [Clostridiales bacterium]|nr:DUF4214 domain-containing protein [Clostridiales bacterium]